MRAAAVDFIQIDAQSEFNERTPCILLEVDNDGNFLLFDLLAAQFLILKED